MKNIFLLLKTDLRELFDRRKWKENKGKSVSFLLFLCLVGLFMIFLGTIYSVIFVQMSLSAGRDAVTGMNMMGGVLTMMLLFMSVVRTKGIFVSKDYEMLMSMPIKKREIVTERILLVYIVELAYSLPLMLPCGVVTAVIGGNVFYFFAALPAVLLLPGLPIVFGALFGALVSLFAERFRYANVLTIVFYVILFAGLMGISFFSGYQSAGEEVSSFYFFLAYLNPTQFFTEWAFTENPLWYLLFVAVNLAVLGVAVAFLALTFDKLVEICSAKRASVRYQAKKLRIKGQFSALLGNEVKRFFNTKAYCMNAIVSGIMAVLVSVMLVFGGKEGADGQLTASFLAAMGILSVIFCLGIFSPAGVGISIEGGAFWQIKSMPIDYKTFARTKIFFSTLVLGVFSLVASLIIDIALRPNGIVAACVILAPLFYLVGESSLGLIINMYHYKLKWKSETEVVKNSSAVIISMISDIGITLLFGISFMLFAMLGETVAAIAVCALSLIFAAICYPIAISLANKAIGKIEC